VVVGSVAIREVAGDVFPVVMASLDDGGNSFSAFSVIEHSSFCVVFKNLKERSFSAYSMPSYPSP
jgi:hypothetical protein